MSVSVSKHREKRTRKQLAKKLAACFLDDVGIIGPCACIGLDCTELGCPLLWELILKNNGLEKAIKLYKEASSIFDS